MAVNRGPGRLAAGLTVALVWMSASSSIGADVFVSARGDDAAAGTAEAPVKSLRKALDMVRSLRGQDKARTAPVVIEVADGRHELAAPLVVLPEDSGTETSPTVIRAAAGARPLISGGRVISGWRMGELKGKPCWEADLEAVPKQGWRFSQLFVNNQRRFRPCAPEEGWRTIAAAVEPTPENAKKGHDRFAFKGRQLDPSWANLDDVEVTIAHTWMMSRLPIARIDPAPEVPGQPSLKVVTFAGHSRYPAKWGSFPKGNRFRAENVREALGAPGSWYLDRPTGRLTYCPLADETPQTCEVVAPRLESLVQMRGDVKGRRWVEHVRFEGLSFAHDNWTMPAGGQSYGQAEINVGAALLATGARHVALTRCAVRHTGRYAVSFDHDCRDCTVERCEFVDLGGGGLLVGTPDQPTDPEARVAGITIRDCTIRSGGRLHPAAVGVWIGNASGSLVEHCDIHDFTYTGVSAGWSWGYGPSQAHDNRLIANRIHDLGQGVLSDMGGVYTLGVSPGTVVEGNEIFDIMSYEYGGWGLYTDEGSTGIVMRNNLVYRTSSGGFHQHFGRDNLVENNIFALARDWQLKRTRAEDHTSFRFERNIVWWNSDAPLIKGPWEQGIVSGSNCYWRGGKPVVFPGNRDLAAWQAAGHDAGSIVADPRFKDPKSGDLSLPDDSPVRPLGFVPFDTKQAGRISAATLTNELPPVPSPWPESRDKQ
jgi:hypothetical protein